MRRRPLSRMVGYSWRSDDPLPHIAEAEALLDRAVRDGHVYQWDGDTGRRVVWLEGWPGEGLRTLRRQLQAWWGVGLPGC